MRPGVAPRPTFAVRGMTVLAPRAALPPALPGRRRTVELPGFGALSWYEDEPATGAGPSPPLLLVHSINAAASAYEMMPLYAHYRRVRAVYAIDLPGYGFSARPDRRYDPRLMTDALHALVAEIRRARGGEPVEALALSLSTEFLARAAVERPADYRGLALVSPTGFGGAQLREGPAGGHYGRPGVLEFLRALGLRRAVFGLLTRRGVIRYFLTRTFGSKTIDAGLLDYDTLTTRPPGAEYAPLHFLSGFLFSRDSGTLYRSLAAPVWLVHGERGDFVRYRGLAALADRHNFSVEVFPTGALPYFERPQEFIDRYDAWRSTARSSIAT
jgi:pimeloyl-ACP methyl ester carboxylesterase